MTWVKTEDRIWLDGSDECLKIIKCWGCSTWFAMAWNLHGTKKTNGDPIYCPNGCKLSLGKSNYEKLQIAKEQLEREVRRKEQAQRDVKTAQRGRAIVQGKMKKLKERVNGGVCPCCNRKFVNLMMHMNHMHPKFREGSTA